MLKRILIGYIFLLCAQPTMAQFDTAAVKRNIVNQSDSMFIAFNNSDWKNFTDYMHPEIIKKANGKEAFIQLLDSEIKQLKGLTFTGYKHTGNIQIVAAGKTLQCVVIYGLEMMIDSTVVSGASTSIGESTDNGITWKFIRNNSTSLEQLYAQFPWISTSLKISKEQQAFNVSLPDFLKTYQPVYFK